MKFNRLGWQKGFSQNCGQAVVEYLLVLIFISVIGIKFANSLRTLMGNSFGSLADVMATHLTVGVCQRDCYFNGFANGYNPVRN